MRRETKLKRKVGKAFSNLKDVSFDIQTSLGSGRDMDKSISALNEAVSELTTALRAYANFRRCQWCRFRVEKEPRENKWIFPGLKEDGPCSKGNSPELLRDTLMAGLGYSIHYYAIEDCPDFESDKRGK